MNEICVDRMAETVHNDTGDQPGHPQVEVRGCSAPDVARGCGNGHGRRPLSAGRARNENAEPAGAHRASSASSSVVQQFLDHANISTTSRYLKITRQGLHDTLARVERERDARGNRVANDRPAADQASPNDSSKSVQ